MLNWHGGAWAKESDGGFLSDGHIYEYEHGPGLCIFLFVWLKKAVCISVRATIKKQKNKYSRGDRGTKNISKKHFREESGTS